MKAHLRVDDVAGDAARFVDYRRAGLVARRLHA
jgi:hypothetical protein